MRSSGIRAIAVGLVLIGLAQALRLLLVLVGVNDLRLAMPLHWLYYRHNNQISVVIGPGASIIHARMRAALAGLDEGEFTERPRA